MPDFLNSQRCKYIRFGDFALIDTLTRDCDDATIQSLMLQLHKESRKFTYHVRKLTSWRKYFKSISNDGRDYIIHINMHKDSSNHD